MASVTSKCIGNNCYYSADTTSGVKNTVNNSDTSSSSINNSADSTTTCTDGVCTTCANGICTRSNIVTLNPKYFGTL